MEQERIGERGLGQRAQRATSCPRHGERREIRPRHVAGSGDGPGEIVVASTLAKQVLGQGGAAQADQLAGQRPRRLD